MTRWLAYCFTAVLLGNEIHQYNNHEDYWIYFFMAASLFDTIMEENKPMWISPYLSHLHRVSFQAVDGFYQVVDAAVQAIRTSFRVSTSSPRMLHQVKVNVYSSIIPSPRFRYTPSYLPFFFFPVLLLLSYRYQSSAVHKHVPNFHSAINQQSVLLVSI